MMKKYFSFFFTLIFIIGCATTPTTGPPGQLATRAMETRNLIISYDDAYRAATNAFFALGYQIKHTDKTSGIIVGSMSNPGIAKKVGWIVLFGVAGALIDTKTSYDLTVMLSPMEKTATTVRVGLAVNGKPVVNKDVTNKFWVTLEREAMIDEPVAKPKEKTEIRKTEAEESKEEKPGIKTEAIKPTETKPE